MKEGSWRLGSEGRVLEIEEYRGMAKKWSTWCGSWRDAFVVHGFRRFLVFFLFLLLPLFRSFCLLICVFIYLSGYCLLDIFRAVYLTRSLYLP